MLTPREKKLAWIAGAVLVGAMLFGNSRPKQLTRNLNLDEFTSHDGVPVPPERYDAVRWLAENLQVIRDYLNRPITVISGFRTAEHNDAVDGANKSKHLTAEAADIAAEGMAAKELHDAVLHLISIGAIHNGGVGLYAGWVHYDTRATPTRWNG